MSSLSTLESLVHDACECAGVDLLEVDLFSVGKRKTLRIYIDKKGGVSVEDCASVSRFLSGELDKDDNENLISSPYTIEVSSPGLDRPLKNTKDFERNLGRKLRVTHGKEITKGVLSSVDESCIRVGDVDILRKEILTAKVEP